MLEITMTLNSVVLYNEPSICWYVLETALIPVLYEHVDHLHSDKHFLQSALYIYEYAHMAEFHLCTKQA
jgi:hypothetical protein